MTETDDQDAVLADYLKLAALADYQMPRLGFFPPTDPEAPPAEADKIGRASCRERVCYAV